MKIVGTKGRGWILWSALAGFAAAAGNPVAAEETVCPVKGGRLTFARTADVSGWYYQSNNPTIWAWPLVTLSLVRNKIDASGLEVPRRRRGRPRRIQGSSPSISARV